jgi:RNA polymerase sigma-70 factor (ECF subfamily)
LLVIAEGSAGRGTSDEERLDPDRSIVERARAGDHDAFTMIALDVGDRLFGIAKLILRDRDRAEDAVQEALIRVWHDLPRLRDPDRFEPWLRRILVNACYDEARRTRRRAEVRILPDAAASDVSGAFLQRERLDRAFRRLPVDQRAVIVMHHYLGMTLAEVAEAVAAPAGTVKSRLHYAMQSMRAALEADDRGAGADAGSRLA